MNARTPSVMTVLGTRPEVIKLAPVIEAVAARSDLDQIVVATAQHREMLDQILEVFGIEPDVDLNVMANAPTPADVAGDVLRSTARLLEEHRPDIVLVQGDTTTVLAASLACFYARTSVGHVEAGLRSHDLARPFPEELNRRVAALAATVHFAPTEGARANLLAEGVAPSSIHVTGNTVVDALHMLDVEGSFRTPGLDALVTGRDRLITVTAHRRESQDHALGEVCAALRDLADLFADIRIVFPVHLNPRVAAVVRDVLSGHDRIHLVEPLPYDDMLRLMRRSHLLLTDSGGIQEEAPSLDLPVVVLRELTERPEVLEVGAGVLAGTDRENIVSIVAGILRDDGAHAAMAAAPNPFGDGHAARRIVDVLGDMLLVNRATTPDAFSTTT